MVVVDDDIDHLALMSHWLEAAGYDVDPVDSAEALQTVLATAVPDCVCLDLDLPGVTGMEMLERLRHSHPQLPVIMVTAEREVDVVVRAMQQGAYDYLSKPLTQLRLTTSVKRAVERASLDRQVLELGRTDADVYARMVGRHPSMRALFREIERVAASDVTVLVHGESGTGKELVARALHDEGARAKKPFVALNCAAIPENLQESELFGHERGAFTGAVERRTGRFEEADGGTLFLDEIAELSLPAQAKLLRVLQERTFSRVGGAKSIASDFRLVAASHRNLMEAVNEGRFREDLFFRVAVFEIDVPPLRERGDDVVLIARRFLAESGLELAPDALELLRGYPWPGNVRELENAVQRALVVAKEGVVPAGDFPSRIRGTTSSRQRPLRTAGTIESLEKVALGDALERHGGDIAKVVAELGISRSTVYRKLKKYGLR